MLDTDLDEIVHIAVGIRSVGVAPFAVVRVGAAVLFAADNVLLQRHPAALADQRMRRIQQRIDRNTEQRRQQLECFRIRDSLAGFPAGDCLPCHEYLFGKCLL